jgi:hypothetical protein
MEERNHRMSLTEYRTGFWNVSQVLGHKRPAFSVADFCWANRFMCRVQSGSLITASWLANWCSSRRIKLCVRHKKSAGKLGVTSQHSTFDN